ncbi:MAG: hypothetical protein JO277_08570 [Candidatus Eremiobacteraeota bacterium]|nr:hypothetical protein [Candidatus Eremiobacteraeota bacterium]
MNVPSLQFLAFCALVAALLAASASGKWRRAILLVANVAFLATFAQHVTSLVPFAGFLAAGYVAMLVADRHRGKLIGLVALLTILVVGFCWLKRYVFFPDWMLLPNVFVTVGLSYAFFRVVSLVVDAYGGVLPGHVGVAAYLNYTINFTSFVAGPIQMYPQFLRNEVEAPAPLDAPIAARAVERIVTGFFKVTVLSPVLFYAQERAVAAAASTLSPLASIADAVLILAIYPIYLYVNFSGYTDAVIGAARFLRLELPENFNRPFASRGCIEFWGRWHMSLSNWFKTYVYSPLLLGLMRRFPKRGADLLLGVVAYFVTFFLVGVWHGQTVMFFILGVLCGGGVSLNKLFELTMVRRYGRTQYQALCSGALFEALSNGLTYLWFAVTLTFSWMSWQQLADLAARFGVATLAGAAVALVLVTAASYRLVRLNAGVALARAIAAPPYVRQAWYAALATIVVSTAVLLNAPAPHIVYKAF